MEILPITKTDKARAFFKNDDYKSCLRILKTFKIGFTKEEKRMLEIAYECLSGKANFYRQLGIDVSSYINQGKLIARKYFSD